MGYLKLKTCCGGPLASSLSCVWCLCGLVVLRSGGGGICRVSLTDTSAMLAPTLVPGLTPTPWGKETHEKAQIERRVRGWKVRHGGRF